MRILHLKNGLTALALAAVTLTGIGPVHAAYTITDLGNITPKGVNDTGQVAGNIGEHAVFYRNGNVQDFGNFGGGRFTSVVDINNIGQILAWNYNINNGWRTEGYIYSTITGTLEDIGSLNVDGYATSINDAGQVVGTYTPIFNSQSHNFLYDNGQITDIGTWGGRYIQYKPTINNSGKIAGSNSLDYVGTTGYISNLNGKGAVNIGNFGTVYGYVNTGIYDLNDLGQAVGFSQSSVDNQTHACFYDGQKLIDLNGILGAKTSTAKLINNKGQIIGTYYDSNYVGHSYLYENGQVTLLDRLLPEDSGWTLTSIYDLNNNGIFVGLGTLNGETHGFLMSPNAAPVPIPPAFLMFGSGLAGLCLLRRRLFKN